MNKTRTTKQQDKVSKCSILCTISDVLEDLENAESAIEKGKWRKAYDLLFAINSASETALEQVQENLKE
jgi:hypothetical protein